MADISKRIVSAARSVRGVMPSWFSNERLLNLYRSDPRAYAHDVLKVEWTPDQEAIALALIQKRKAFVKASHSVGKTMLGGGLINWKFDCWKPGIIISTAPTKASIDDNIWKEVRIQRRGRPGLMPKASRMESAPDHFAVGYTAENASAFQGRHEEHGLMLFDEAVGIDMPFWTAAEGIVIGPGWMWLAIMNPTDTASAAYLYEQRGQFEIITLSALNHPNIQAELRGELPPYPKAVRLSWVLEKIEDWCTPLSSTDKKEPGDIEFPPGSGKWYRPGPEFESKVLGRWPSQGSYSVWGEAVWNMTQIRQPIPEAPLEIGCDVARFGDDFTSIHARRGRCSLHHETHNGWGTEQTSGRLKQLCKELAQPGEDPREVLCKIDDDGVGGGVYDQRGDYRFDRLSAAESAIEEDKYPNRRSELWFATAQLAAEGLIDLTRIEPRMLDLLRIQAMAPKFKLDSAGRRVAESKDDLKKRLKRSPDDMDAMNLAYAPPSMREITF